MTDDWTAALARQLQDPAMMTVEEAEAMAQARVAAALREAADAARVEAAHKINGAVVCHGEMATYEMESDADDVRGAILALIPDAGGALDRALREAVLAERERCAKIADAREAKNERAAMVAKHTNVRAAILNRAGEASAIAAAIRAQEGKP